MTQYRVLLKPEVMQQLVALSRAAKTQQSGGLRRREFQALKQGLRALADGREEDFDGKRLGYRRHDLSDCAEIKLAVVPETRHNVELGPSHRLIYREFESDDGGPPYREVVAFAHRKDDRPFDEAARRLNREAGVRSRTTRAALQPDGIAPIRQPLPPELRKALAAASGVAPARAAVHPRSPAQRPPPAGPRRGAPPNREL
ncbi:hypothetical protein ACIBL3_45335 [Kribbella sp. NPDC050124]|uniref:hypothetical protein n=1 Tax=Kribbella sp. NPDC050124 TaxID=3364114 RepID=UPI0037897C91